MKNILFPVLVVVVLVSAALMLTVILKGSFHSPSRPNLTQPPTETVQANTYIGWLEYFNSNLGLSLMYPPQFKNYQGGSLSSKIRIGSKSGSQICVGIVGCFQNQSGTFEIRTTSKGWVDAKILPAFTDLQGYRRDGDTFFVWLPSGEEFQLPDSLAAEISTPNNLSVLIISGFSGEESGLAYPNPGWIGAIFNTGFSDYPGLVVQMQLTSDLIPDIFRLILESFRFPWKNEFPSDDAIQAEPRPPRFYDPQLKSDLIAIARIVNCRYRLDSRYPQYYFPDQACGKSQTITNAVTQKPYYYTATNDGQGFILKVKFSSGEIYTLTEANFPASTPAPK